MNEGVFKLIMRYALVLGISYAIETAFGLYLEHFADNLEIITQERMSYWVLAPNLLWIVLNVITSWLVSRDIRKYQIRTRYVILTTMLYRPLGVCIFLLYAMYDEKNHQLGNDKQQALSDQTE